MCKAIKAQANALHKAPVQQISLAIQMDGMANATGHMANAELEVKTCGCTMGIDRLCVQWFEA